MEYQSHFSYSDFLLSRAKYAAVANSYTFSSYYFKGLTVGGQCGDWTTYASKQLQLPFDDVQFSQITSDYKIYDFAKKQSRSVTAVCRDTKVVSGIISSLRYGTEFEGNCNFLTWRVFKCSGKAVFCVNCKKNCVPTVSCPGTSFITNPCGSCKNYAVAGAVVNAQYSFLKLYPEMSFKPKVFTPL